MAVTPLTLRELNRTTLCRQLLLQRHQLSVIGAIERLAGMQGQASRGPFIGLWSRLDSFQSVSLVHEIELHKVVKAAFIRGTLHLVTASDYENFRSTLQPMLTAGWKSLTKDRNVALSAEEIVASVRSYIEDSPRTFAEISDYLGRQFPGQDVGSLRHAVRTHFPLVQVPNNSQWSYPAQPQFTPAAAWTDGDLSNSDKLQELILRYLAAFGPASVTDMQAWSGFSNLKDVVEQMRSKLVSYRDENRRELVDLLGAPLMDAEVVVPVRFLPEYDNLLLSHQNRRRFIADEHRSSVYLPGLRVAPTFLIDGFVAGTWEVETVKRAATLVLRPFSSVGSRTRQELLAEAQRLVEFIEPDKIGDARIVD